MAAINGDCVCVCVVHVSPCQCVCPCQSVSVCLSVSVCQSLSVCQCVSVHVRSVRVSLCQCVCLSVSPCQSMSVCLSVSLCQCVCLSVCLSVHVSLCQCVCLSVRVSLCQCVCQSICLSSLSVLPASIRVVWWVSELCVPWWWSGSYWESFLRSDDGHHYLQALSAQIQLVHAWVKTECRQTDTLYTDNWQTIHWL